MLKCPACHIPLCGIVYEGVTIHVCPECWGALVDDDRLRLIRKRSAREWSDEEKARAAQEAARADQLARLRCPRCLREMAKVKAACGHAEYHVDLCKRCAVAWFDRGELELAQMQHRAEREARKPEDWDLIARRALAECELEDECARLAERARTARDLSNALLLNWDSGFWPAMDFDPWPPE